jgi:hypothetical protein
MTLATLVSPMLTTSAAPCKSVAPYKKPFNFIY